MDETRKLTAAGFMVAVAACGGGATDPAPPPERDPPRPATVEVTPGSAELTVLGATVRLTAQVRDQYGGPMTGAAVSWSTDAAEVATVDASGVVTATGDGAAIITAAIEGAADAAAVEVYDFTGMLTRFADRHGIGAAALGVMKHGELFHEVAVGSMDAARLVPIRPDVMMRLASVTKPITAAAVRHLADRGMLSLDDLVFDLGQGGGLLEVEPFPELGDSRLADVTVRHLLQHRGGWDREIVGDPIHRPVTIAREMGVPSPPGRHNTVRHLLGQPLQFDPGSRRAYANAGYLLLGLIIEKVSGQDYIGYVRENILGPLGIGDEDIIPGRTFPEDRSDREPWYDDAGRQLVRNVFDPDGPPVRWPDGGWHHEAMIASGGLVASPGALLEFVDAYRVAPFDDIGIRRDTEAPTVRRYHTGGLPGTQALAAQRGDGFTYVVIFNRRDLPGPDYVAYATRFRDSMEARLGND